MLRYIAGGIFGAMLFGIWPFVEFAGELLGWSGAGYVFALLVMTLVACLLAIGFSRAKRLSVAAAGAMSFFAVSLVVVFGFNAPAKLGVAEMVGFFNGDNPFSNIQPLVSGQKFVHDIGGYSLVVPAGWQKRVLPNSGLSYFVEETMDGQQVELRPRCFHRPDISLPEIVLNMEGSAQCFHWEDGAYACLVKRGDSRWRWLALSKADRQGVELDFVISEMDEALESDIGRVISSVQLLESVDTSQACRSIQAWF